VKGSISGAPSSNVIVATVATRVSGVDRPDPSRSKAELNTLSIDSAI